MMAPESVYIVSVISEAGMKMPSFYTSDISNHLLSWYQPHLFSCGSSGLTNVSNWITTLSSDSLQSLAFHFYVENRMGCWFSPQLQYASSYGITMIDPLNNIDCLSVLNNYSPSYLRSRYFHIDLLRTVNSVDINDLYFCNLKTFLKNLSFI